MSDGLFMGSLVWGGLVLLIGLVSLFGALLFSLVGVGVVVWRVRVANRKMDGCGGVNGY